MSHIYCPECGFQNPEAANYCSKCGALLHSQESGETTQTFSPEVFTNVGIDPTRKHVLVVKSMQHFYAGFAPIARQILYVSAPGALVPDFKQLNYENARRDLWMG